MDYICLAAGKGTRFGNLGRYLQKCMYPVALRPFLEYSLQNLVRSRYVNLERDRLIIVVGHHAEQLKNYFGSSYQGLRIDYVEQKEQRGTGHALHLVCQQQQPTSAVMVWLADLYVPTTLFERVYKHEQANVLTIAPNPIEKNDNVRVSIAGERISEAWCGSSEFFDIGLWKLSPQVLQLMLSRREKEYRVLPNLQNAIEQGINIGYVGAEEWLHLGGTEPSPEENVQAVVSRVLELEKQR